jgi:uncharacterized membrane protein YoaK (UPF0700 family)
MPAAVVFGIFLAMAGVIGAEHQHRDFRREAVHAVLQAPQHVLGAVAAEAEAKPFSGW